MGEDLPTPTQTGETEIRVTGNDLERIMRSLINDATPSCNEHMTHQQFAIGLLICAGALLRKSGIYLDNPRGLPGPVLQSLADGYLRPEVDALVNHLCEEAEQSGSAAAKSMLQ